MGKHTRTLTVALLAAAFGIVATSSRAVALVGETGMTRAVPQAQKAVLVTGASTGIGRNITETLASKGYFVYAGARKAEDLRSLNAIENVQSIRLDVTIPEEIAAAVETVRNGGRGLYGLVNNAGVAIVEPLIEVEEEDLDFIFDVNIYGPYRVTKAFIPLLIEAKGRVTTIGSISGILSGPLMGPYSMSKHAVEAYTDALGAELARVDVQVSVIEPGNYRSAMSQNVLDRIEEQGRDVEGSLYERELRGFMSMLGRESQDLEPDAVADAALHALFDENPKIRYMVVPNQSQAEGTIRKAISELVQLNEGHVFSYDRDALVAMLDEALSNSRH